MHVGATWVQIIRLAAKPQTHVQNLLTMAAIAAQNCQLFAMTLGEQMFELKDGDSR